MIAIYLLKFVISKCDWTDSNIMKSKCWQKWSRKGVDKMALLSLKMFIWKVQNCMRNFYWSFKDWNVPISKCACTSIRYTSVQQQPRMRKHWVNGTFLLKSYIDTFRVHCIVAIGMSLLVQKKIASFIYRAFLVYLLVYLGICISYVDVSIFYVFMVR